MAPELTLSRRMREQGPSDADITLISVFKQLGENGLTSISACKAAKRQLYIRNHWLDYGGFALCAGAPRAHGATQCRRRGEPMDATGSRAAEGPLRCATSPQPRLRLASTAPHRHRLAMHTGGAAPSAHGAVPRERLERERKREGGRE
jgi:hypothetical protein